MIIIRYHTCFKLNIKIRCFLFQTMNVSELKSIEEIIILLKAEDVNKTFKAPLQFNKSKL